MLLAKIALVVRFIELVEQPHVRQAVQGGSTRQNQLVAAGRVNQVADGVKQHVFEQKLRGGGLVHAFARDLRMLDAFDIEPIFFDHSRHALRPRPEKSPWSVGNTAPSCV